MHILKDLFLDALRANQPDGLVKQKLAALLKNQEPRPVYFVSVGKASTGMARAVLEVPHAEVKKGLVITAHGDNPKPHSAVEVYYSTHPIPDAKSLQAGQKLVDFVQSVPAGALLITLISGGTSSLVCLPSGEISMTDLANMHQLLLRSGANISEINTVRKHLSGIKGGQLLRFMNPQIQLIDLIISDVPGDNTEIVGSGLSIPDSSTFRNARQVLQNYELWERVPESVRRHIKKGLEGRETATVKIGEDPVLKHESYIVGSAGMLAEYIAGRLSELGYMTITANQAYSGDVERVATVIAEQAIKIAGGDRGKAKPRALVFYGESTVHVRGDGKGGRNQELALRAALKIDGYKNITWFSAGTDGIDGPTDAAGAVVTGETVSKAKEKGVDPVHYLKNNDSYQFHKIMDTLLKTGATGNNLMDVQIVLIS